MSNNSKKGRNVATVILALLAIGILGAMAFLVGRAGFGALKQSTGTSAAPEDTVAAFDMDAEPTETPEITETPTPTATPTPTETPTPTPEPTPTEEPKPEKTYPDTVYANGYDINVRASASTDAEALGAIQRGQALTRTGEEGDWSQVEFNGGTGYVKTEFLSEDLTYDTVWDLTTLSNERLDFGYSSENRDGDNVPTDWRWYESKWGQFNVDWIQDTTQKTIYLTMDEGFGNDNTIQILDTLKEKNVKAVFFLTEYFIEERPELVRRMIDEGHILGNHTCTHPVMPELSIEDQTVQIENMQNALKDQYGYTMKLFRFPEGAYSDQSLGLVNNLGLKAVFWSFAYVDYNDDDQPPVDEALELALNSLHPGAIYLLHAKSDTNTAMLADFIDGARERGFEFGIYPESAN